MSSSGQKSSVAHTCNLLSHCFKENGRFATKPEANNKDVETMNWLPKLENSAEIWRTKVEAKDFFANIPTLIASSNVKSDAILLEQGITSQLTIFYAGKVFVFSDFPAEKVNEIMALASKGSSNNITPDSNRASVTNTNKIFATPVQFKKASLQRFFEKRKDRVAARGPYQHQVKNDSSMAASGTPKPEDQSKYPGLELEGQSSKQLDLNL